MTCVWLDVRSADAPHTGRAQRGLLHTSADSLMSATFAEAMPGMDLHGGAHFSLAFWKRALHNCALLQPSHSDSIAIPSTQPAALAPYLSARSTAVEHEAQCIPFTDTCGA